MFDHPKRVFFPLAAVCAALFAASAALGSNGPTKGDPDVGQRIANVTMPLTLLAVLVLVVLGAAYGVARLRTSRR